MWSGLWWIGAPNRGPSRENIFYPLGGFAAVFYIKDITYLQSKRFGDIFPTREVGYRSCRWRSYRASLQCLLAPRVLLWGSLADHTTAEFIKIRLYECIFPLFIASTTIKFKLHLLTQHHCRLPQWRWEDKYMWNHKTCTQYSYFIFESISLT